MGNLPLGCNKVLLSVSVPESLNDVSMSFVVVDRREPGRGGCCFGSSETCCHVPASRSHPPTRSIKTTSTYS